MRTRTVLANPRWLLSILLFSLLVAGISHRASAQQPATGQVNLILWFDTEDYMLPADDDAAKRLAEMLTQRGIRATFKVVGEKARVLERRGRTDVIEALKKHDIGYHSNFHSVHPVPAEYLADCGLLDGIDEFIRHEARGSADVRRIFSVPSLVCYGQPGSSWAPQAIAALGQCGIGTNGIPCYVDSGSHIGIKGKPYWYCGVLTVYDMQPNETRMDLWDPAALPKAEKAVSDIADRLSKEGGGLISMYYHPCEWVHERFWDAVNFSRGANPPREQWIPEPQRPAEQTEAAFGRFAQYIDYVRAIPGLKFVTASQLPTIYPDVLREDGASPQEVHELATRILSKDSTGVDFQMVGRKAFSPADQFALLAQAVAALISQKGEPDRAMKIPPALLGPDGPAPRLAEQKEPLNWFAFRDAALDANDFVQQHHRIPARVFIGPDPVSPADFLIGVAAAYTQLHDNRQPQATVALGHGVELLTARRVTDDKPSVYGGWIIHRANYRAPKILDVARLQAWTLKPAVMGNHN